MGSDRSKQLVLAVLVLVFAVVVYRAWTSSIGSAMPASPSASTASALAAQEVAEPPDVRLESLHTGRPEPGDTARNLFRFGARPAPSERPTTPGPASPPPPSPVGSRPMASTAPIALKFIGIVEAPNRALRLAILSDGRGVYHGREGDIIEGRYRIVTIGVESIEMSRLDGSGSQTIRLNGS